MPDNELPDNEAPDNELPDNESSGWKELISLTDTIEVDRPVEETLLELINLVNPDLPEGPLDANNVEFESVTGIEIEPDTGGPNSKLTLASIFGQGYRGNADITYNRINLEEYVYRGMDVGSVFIPGQNFHTVEDVVDYLNGEYFLKLQKDHLKNLTHPINGDEVVIESMDDSLLYVDDVTVYLYDRADYTPNANKAFIAKVNPYNANGQSEIHLRFTGLCGKVNINFGDGDSFYSADIVSERIVDHRYYPDSNSFTISIEVIEGEDIKMEIGGSSLEEIVSMGDFDNVTGASFSVLSKDVYSPNLTTVPNSIPDHITDISGMFAGADHFNQDLSNWNVENITNMNRMFYNASIFDQDITMWNTSSVEDFSNMFYRASAFNQDISSWNTSAATNMSGMFSYAIKFDQDIGNWDVSDVTNMTKMFYYSSVFNKPLANWKPSNVTNVDSMFAGAVEFDQDLSSWSLPNIGAKPPYFAYGSPLNNHSDHMPSWGV